MIYLEIIMLIILSSESIFSSITDIKSGMVYNRFLLYAAIAGVLVNVAYFHFFAHEYLMYFLINLFAGIILSSVFYAYHIWAAGDSKLFILTCVLIPARIYSENGLVAIPALNILMYTFSIAFIYVICESAILDIKDKSRPSIKLNFKKKLLIFLKQYIYCTVYLMAFYQIVSFILPEAYSQNMPLLLLLNMLFILTLINFNLFNPLLLIAGAVVIVIGFIASGTSGLAMPDLKSSILIVALILLKEIAQRHNYKEIPTKDVKAGMVLSFATIARFFNSRVQGLPQSTTEDISSRISTENAESIIRWGKSATGQSTIVIVRKIPFAIFITIGTLIFVLGGVIK